VPPIPRARNSISRPEPRRHLMPQGREMAGLEHQHPFIGRPSVLVSAASPCPGCPMTGRRRRCPRSARPASCRRRSPAPSSANSGPRWSIVGHRDRLQYPVRHIRRAGDLQKNGGPLWLRGAMFLIGTAAYLSSGRRAWRRCHGSASGRIFGRETGHLALDRRPRIGPTRCRDAGSPKPTRDGPSPKNGHQRHRDPRSSWKVA